MKDKVILWLIKQLSDKATVKFWWLDNIENGSRVMTYEIPFFKIADEEKFIKMKYHLDEITNILK